MRFVICLIVGLCVVLAGFELFAGDGDEEGGCDGRHQRPALKRILRHVRKVFAEKDTNGDDALSLEEWGGRERIFNAMDRNKDGKVTRREMAAFLIKRLKNRKNRESE